MKKAILISLCAILFCFKMHSQVPPNDNCSGAILLTDGNLVSSSTDYATDSGINSSCGSSAFGDVWYKFIAPSNGEMYLYLGETDDIPYINYAVFDDCLGTNEITCGNNSNEISLSSLQAGATYYIVIEKVHLPCRGECDTNFTILASQNVLSQDEFTFNSVSIYPNPVKDILTIKAVHNITKVNIYNVLGKELKSKSLNAEGTKIRFTNLQAGIYFIKVYSNTRFKTYKIIKQ